MDFQMKNSIKFHVGDITKLQVDAIVNAANSSLLGGGGVDGAIHRAAGPGLLDECRTLNGCRTGEAKITGGYNLPAAHVIHTVGPIYSGSASDPEDLRNCYWNSLEVAKANNLHSIAFPGISTGVYGYPKREAAQIALSTVKEWLAQNADYDMEVTFVNFSEGDYQIYQSLN
ncbi:MAG: O-acetyl-ADP-ribose deacetylase [Butyrivibrio sp.]|uniref:O-acetyl-ADP-ribose deacetylase n=1 Tax=Butyrivibrio sp. TaxID=28121 RepID=UPI0025BD56EA|nr:O-acetyl-ADP-ribose deacetylase [Butyrivibrio sp.]MBQ6589435.1 O-acetyl-ADP-ribose deacetylase [Butyrivibrio sp.]